MTAQFSADPRAIQNFRDRSVGGSTIYQKCRKCGATRTTGQLIRKGFGSAIDPTRWYCRDKTQCK
jgi:hypothetical protein